MAPPGNPDILAEHYEQDSFKLPITVTVLDQKNASMKITIAASSEVVWH
jgi:hypothetical protein